MVRIRPPAAAQQAAAPPPEEEDAWQMIPSSEALAAAAPRAAALSAVFPLRPAAAAGPQDNYSDPDPCGPIVWEIIAAR